MPRKKVIRIKPPKSTNFKSHYVDGDYIEDLDCDYGQACHMLKMNWIKLKIANREGDELMQIEAKEKINNIQDILGIKITVWKDDYDIDNEPEQDDEDEFEDEQDESEDGELSDMQ